MLRRRASEGQAGNSLPEGARSVGELAELDEPMQVFVLYLRRWIGSLEGRERVWHDARSRFGPRAKDVVANLDAFLVTVAGHVSRPLQRHGERCPCVGADEARMVAILQAAGRRDATLLRLLVPQFIEGQGFKPVVSAALALNDELAVAAETFVNDTQQTLH